MKKFQAFKLTRKEMTGIVAGGGNYKCTEYKEDGSAVENLCFDYGPLDLPSGAECKPVRIEEVGLEKEN